MGVIIVREVLMNMLVQNRTKSDEHKVFWSQKTAKKGQNLTFF